jgi:hypothetical protein
MFSHLNLPWGASKQGRSAHASREQAAAFSGWSGVEPACRSLWVLTRVLLLLFVLYILGKLFFRPQLGLAKKWLDGVVNALLIAILIVSLVQLGLWLTS